MRLTATNSCGAPATAEVYVYTYSNIDVTANPMLPAGVTQLQWTGAYLPPVPTVFYSGSNARGSLSSTSSRSGSYNINDCSGNAPGMAFPVDAPSINATGATYVYWPPQPTLSALTVPSRSTDAIAVAFSASGHSYFQARYKATGTAGDFLSKGDNIAGASSSFTFDGLNSNKEYRMKISASNCRHKLCDGNNSYCAAKYILLPHQVKLQPALGRYS